MGWSDIIPGTRYGELELRRAAVEFVRMLGLRDLTLVGESMGAAIALHASIELGANLRGVIAFNPYDYTSGLERSNWFARLIGTGVRLPGSGPIFARMESRPVLKGVLRVASPTTTHCPKTCSASCGAAAAATATPG